jgi:hypothetical protein
MLEMSLKVLNPLPLKNSAFLLSQAIGIWKNFKSMGIISRKTNTINDRGVYRFC